LQLTLPPRYPDDLVFTGVKRGALRAQVFQRAVLTEAADALGLGGLPPHVLRHIAASLAITSGANIKVVQQMRGDKSATLTLDLCGHLFPDQLDEVADRMDAAARSLSLPNSRGASVTPIASEIRRPETQPEDRRSGFALLGIASDVEYVGHDRLDAASPVAAFGTAPCECAG